MDITFTATIWTWRGPAPYFFVTVPPEDAEALKEILRLVTYGWGMIPVQARIGKTEWKTSMWPKNGSYILPLKDSVREAEQLAEGDEVQVRIEVK